MDDAARRKEVSKVFDHITDNAYTFAMISNYSFFTHTKDVMLNSARAVRAENVNPHEFGWK